ncbi:MAG: BamA/TamA family outer membrane protein [Myxococcales bacterium]|nr:BamA/TamA family outer membrane protein [Myxococcales bacterium]
MTVRGACTMLLVALVLSPMTALRADPTPPPTSPATDGSPYIEAADLDAPFGPPRHIEHISVRGAPAHEVREIVAVLPFAVGDTLAAGDSALRDAKLRVLSLGTYRDAAFAISKGSERGSIIIAITVWPRPGWSLNRLWLGTSHASSAWLGGEVERKNVWRRLDVAGSILGAMAGDIAGDGAQSAIELRATRAPYVSTPFGGQLVLRLANYHEPIQISGAPGSHADADFTSLAYRYGELAVRGLWDLDRPTRLRAGPRIGILRGGQVPALTRTHEGATQAIDVGLLPGTSVRASANVGIEYDVRDHPRNPRRGFFGDLDADVLISGLGSDYAAVKLRASLEHWLPLSQGRRALGVLAQGQVVFGDPPRSDRIYVNDLYPWLPMRSLGMALATRAPSDLLGTGIDRAPAGNQAASVAIQFVQRIAGRRSWLVRGDFFVSAGLFTLRDTKEYAGVPHAALPLGILADVGVRFETRFGIVELSLANLGSRLP